MADQAIFKADDLVISGNLVVKGTEEIITTTQTDLHIKDRVITLNKGATLGGNTAGIEIESGGSIVATLGYTLASGFNFGNKNITTTGTVNGIFDLSNNTTNDLPEGTGGSANLYYTDARADARVNAGFGSKTTDNLNEGSSNLYYTEARANSAIDARVATTSINLLTDVNTSGVATNNTLKWNGTNWVPGDPGHSTTDTLTEGSTNKYYLDSRVLTKINATSIDELSDVDTSTVAPVNGQFLIWNGTNFVPKSIAVGISAANKGNLSSNLTHASTSTGAGGDHGTIVMQGPLHNYGTAKFLVSIDLTVTQTHPHLSTSGSAGIGHANKYEFKVHKAINGAALGSYASPIYTATIAGWEEHISLQFIDDGTLGVNHGANPNGITYHFTTNTVSNGATVYNDAGASAVASTITVTSINGFAVELNDQNYNLGDMNNVVITSPAEGQSLYYENASSQWKNQIPTLNKNSDVTISSASAGKVLRYNGTAWVDVDANTVAGSINLTSLADVDTAGASDNNKLLQYDHSTTSFKWTSGLDVITEVVDDVTPQLGGNLDVNGYSLVSTSNGNITLAPNGTGQVIITGDLTVTGTATTMDVQNITVEDPLILLNKHDSQPATNSSDAGIMVQRGSTENNTAWFWDESDERWKAVLTTSNSSATDVVETSKANIDFHTSYSVNNEAHYADLAEVYESDDNYEPGTVVVFGGDKEVTQCRMLLDHRVAGVVSTNPAYLMNKDGDGVAVALRGKVPCKVEGPVRKGDVLVTNVTPGTACTLTDDSPTPPGFAVIGKSLETDETTGIKLINIVV